MARVAAWSAMLRPTADPWGTRCPAAEGRGHPARKWALSNETTMPGRNRQRAARTEQEDRSDNIEHLVEVRRGRPYLDERRAKAELAKVDADLTRLRGDVAVLEERRSKLLAELSG